MDSLKETNFRFAEQKGFYRGKVRDVYFFEQKMAVVASDRISAFDVILPRAIPYKGQVLNQIAAHFLADSRHIVPNWMLETPHPNLTIGLIGKPFKVEMVIRGYLVGHAWREYQAGKRSICGVPLPEGLRENEKLPQAIITPTTKAAQGHDEDISKEEIIHRKIVSAADYEQIESYTHQLYAFGVAKAAERGLILADTKYEFARIGDTIGLIDEIHTPDSSRYFYADGFEETFRKGETPRQLSKEFVRQWLIANHFQGKDGQQIPEMTHEIILSISERYIELYEKIVGEKFVKTEYTSIFETLENSIQASCLNA
jgi:phosphoribosylaminoimidazole-succinocarboxamide synthase